MSSKECATDQIPKEAPLQRAPAGIDLPTKASDFASSLTGAKGLEHWKTQAGDNEELAKNLERRDKWGEKLLFVWRSIRQMPKEERERFSDVFKKIEKIGNTCLDYQGFMNNYNEVIEMLEGIAKQGGRRRRGKTAKKGRKTRKTRRGGWPWTKVEEKTPAQMQAAQAAYDPYAGPGAANRLGIGKESQLAKAAIKSNSDAVDEQLRKTGPLFSKPGNMGGRSKKSTRRRR